MQTLEPSNRLRAAAELRRAAPGLQCKPTGLTERAAAVEKPQLEQLEAWEAGFDCARKALDSKDPAADTRHS